MCATLADDHPPNFSTTNRAGLPLAVVDLEVILKVSAPIHPVQAGTVMPEALLQHGADGFPERRRLPPPEGI